MWGTFSLSRSAQATHFIVINETHGARRCILHFSIALETCRTSCVPFPQIAASQHLEICDTSQIEQCWRRIEERVIRDITHISSSRYHDRGAGVL